MMQNSIPCLNVTPFFKGDGKTPFPENVDPELYNEHYMYTHPPTSGFIFSFKIPQMISYL